MIMIAAAWGSKNKQAQQLQHLAATSQQHLEQMEERELEAAAKQRDEEAEILLSTRDREIKNASEKYDPRVQKLEANSNPKPPSKTTGLGSAGVRECLQECQVHREQELNH